MGTKFRKILLCAYACEPGFSSEREIGWKWANLLANKSNVFVLTRQSNKNTIENYITENNIDNKLKFIYYDLPEWLRKWKKGEKGLYLYYTLWQFGAYLKASKTHKKEKFDIVHYLTFGSLLLPTFMSFMPTKFVLGPVGGGENVPLRFIRNFPLKGKITEIIRQLIQAIQRINPLFLITCLKSDKILVRTKETYKMIPFFWRKKTVLMLETGAPEELLHYKRKETLESSEIKIVTVGRFIHSKINIFTLQVIKDFKSTYNIPFKFIIIGDGYQKENLQHFCKENNLEENVVFTGWIPRDKVFDYLSQSDIYFSTTFKEGGTWAFFEAVAIGLPIVCIKISGPDMIVADGCGVKVEPTNQKETMKKMSKGLYDLSVSSTLRENYSKKAKEVLIQNLTWKNMMTRIEAVYQEIND